MSDWEPEPRDVPEELTPDYAAEPYADPWNSIKTRIAEANPDLLMKLANWGIGEPHA